MKEVIMPLSLAFELVSKGVLTLDDIDWEREPTQQELEQWEDSLK